jgi:hypothetical protein
MSVRIGCHVHMGGNRDVQRLSASLPSRLELSDCSGVEQTHYLREVIVLDDVGDDLVAMCWRQGGVE